MGVVYKLTSDVIDFILSQKKTTPALGCRDLAKIVSQEFEVPVSKSSVNSVLQQNRLSSPLGRRSISGKKKEKKKFEIPLERKQQIFPSLTPQGLGRPDSQEVKHAGIEKPSQKPWARPDLTPTGLKAAPDGEIYENAGAVFLWATLREISNRSVLAKLLTGDTPEAFTDEISSVMDAVVIARALDLDPEGSLSSGKNQAFWPLCHLEKIKDPLAFYHQVAVKDLQDDVIIKAGLELPARLAQIQQVKIALEDGTEIFWDSQLAMMSGAIVQSEQLVFLEKCLDVITSQITNNVQTAILMTAPTISQMGSEDFSDTFYSMLYAFENFSGKRMAKVILYDSLGNELVTFDTLPEKKRYFVAGLWPWQVKFSEIRAQIRRERKPQKVFLNALEKDFYVTETEFNFTDDKAGVPAIRGRAFFLATGSSPEFEAALVTNAPATQMPILKAVSEYLLRWPNLAKGPTVARSKAFMEAPETATQEKNTHKIDINEYFSNSYDYFSLLESFSKAICDACLNKFFESSQRETSRKDILTQIFNLPAKLFMEKDHVKILFLLPSGKPFLYRPILEQAVFLLNEAGIKDKNSLFLRAAIS